MRRGILLMFTTILLSFPPTLWADAYIKAHREASITTTGAQTFTIAGLNGATPKGAIVTVTMALTDNTEATHSVLSYGVTDCTNEFSLGASDRSGLLTTDTNRRGSRTQAVTIYDPAVAGGTTIEASADASCAANAIVLTWDVAPAVAYLVHIVAFVGSDWQLKANSFVQNTTIDGILDIVDVGFQPEVVFCGAMGVGSASFLNNSADSRLGLGVAVASPASQGSVSQASGDAITGGATYGGGTSTLYACNSSIPADFLEGTVELGTFDAQGFTATTRLESHTFEFIYLAATTGGKARHWSGPIAAPAAPETTTYSGPGWTPGGGIIFWQGSTLADTEYTDDNAGILGMSLMDATNQFTVTTRGDDTAVTSATGSLSDNIAVHVLSAAGANRLVGTLTSFGATGPIINWTTTSATVGYGWFLESIATRPPRRVLFLN